MIFYTDPAYDRSIDHASTSRLRRFRRLSSLELFEVRSPYESRRHVWLWSTGLRLRLRMVISGTPLPFLSAY